MKLVITAPWGVRLGGAEQLLWTFVRAVDRRRIEPVVVFLAAGPFAGEIASLDVETAVIPVSRLRNVADDVAAVRRLRRLILAARPGLVLDWTTKSHVIGGVAAAASGYAQRSAWWQHGFPGGGPLDRVAAALPARVIFCPSEAVAAAQRAAAPRRRTIVVHPFVDVSDPVAVVPRGELGIPTGRFVVGIVGRLQPWKRQHLVLEAVADLVARGHDAHALVVGGDAHGLSPGYVAQLRERAATAALAGRVTFTGHVDAPASYFEAIDVLVNASTEEPFGMVLVEAMAAGKPVVAFAAGGPVEIIERDTSGLLLTGEPRAALAAALERLATDLALRERLATGARRRFAAEFAPARLVARLSDDLVRLAQEADSA